MAYTDTTSSAPFGAILTYRVVNSFDVAFATVRGWNAARRTARALNALTDYQLEDIGLARSDIANVSRTANFR